MGYVSKENKIKIKYVFPKEYEYYIKTLQFEDGKISLKSNYCKNCVDELDIWFKLYFLCASNDTEETINSINASNGNKSDFKYFFAGSGLRKIFGYNIKWSMDKIFDVFRYTYPCILLAGEYWINKDDSVKEKSEEMYVILKRLLESYDGMRAEPGKLINYIVPFNEAESCIFIRRILKSEDEYIERCSEETIRTEQRKLRDEVKNYKKEEKQEIITRVKDILEEFCKEEEKMQEAYRRIKKRNKLNVRARAQAKNVADSNCTDELLQNEKIDIEYMKCEQCWRSKASLYKMYVDESELWEEYEDELASKKISTESNECVEQNNKYFTMYGQGDKRLNYMKNNRNIRREEVGIEDILNVKINAEYMEELLSLKAKAEVHFEMLEEDNADLISDVRPIVFQEYLKLIMKVLVKYYNIFPLIPQESIYQKKKSRYVGNPLIGKNMYNQLFKIRKLCEGLNMEEAAKKDNFLDKYYEFYYKSLKEIRGARSVSAKLDGNRRELISTELQHVGGYYLLEQIFALELFQFESEIILKYVNDTDKKAIMDESDRLNYCLKIIYGIRGVYTRRIFAENFLNDFFKRKMYSADRKTWDVFQQSFCRLNKTQKIFEKYKLLELFEEAEFKSGIEFSTIRNEIINGTSKRRCEGFSKIDISKWNGENWSELKKRVIPFDKKVREIQKNIIIASTKGIWN